MSSCQTVNNSDPISISDEEETDLDPTQSNGSSRSVPVPSYPVISGTLCKWTNYVYGWQDRYISLKDGTLSYYKSENDVEFGCRGSISIKKAAIRLHEFDECRFDVSVGDCVWCLRADDPDTRNKWVNAIESYKQYVDSAYGSENSLRRHGSALSLGSISLTSMKKDRNLFEKLSEVQTYKNILCQQIDSLQSHLDTFSKQSHVEEDTAAKADASCASSSCDQSTSPACEVIDATGGNSISSLKTPGQAIFEFKGEAITFKETTAEILETLTHCIDVMQQRDETWKKRLEKEIEKRKKLEEQLTLYTNCNGAGKTSKVIIGPDYEEGPHSLIEEDEFFDALDAMLDKHDQQEKEKRIIKQRAKEIGQPSSLLPEKVDHPLWPEVERVTNEQLYYARLEVGEGGEGGWELFAEEGEMRLFKREVEVDGLVCDPLKAVHIVKGVTAHELCYHFFSPDVRWDWENTLESMKMVEEVNPNTLVFHQIHKRVWPAAQRDAVFWSHIRKISHVSPSTMVAKDGSTLHLRDLWLVCNKSTDVHDIPLGRCVRMKMTVSMTCETYVPSLSPGRTLTRDDLTCKIIYCSTINPGGWAPASVLRALYKREYPKFLKRYTQYVVEAQENKPILF